MVAAVAAKIGMKCRLIQESWVPHEDAVYDRVGNIMLSRIMGAEIQLVDEGFDIGIRESWTTALADVKAKGGKPYAIPAGASVHKFGGLGYVGFAEEVRAQEKEMAVKFDFIVVCTVTGSTHAGMVVGFGADGRERNVIGIDASCTPKQTKAQVLDIAQKTSALVGGKNVVADDIILLEDYAYPVYGVPSKETVEAIRLSARLEGMITDPVYEGKSMQGMIDLVQKRFFPKGSKVLYAHLGGAPARNGRGASGHRRSHVKWSLSLRQHLGVPGSLSCCPRNQEYQRTPQRYCVQSCERLSVAFRGGTQRGDAIFYL
jgi:1-aminocyclopropane-1-carboxylate deaminase